ncbi:unnamed protein product, partial [Ectocarpus sp. 12 AP-2014]
ETRSNLVHVKNSEKAVVLATLSLPTQLRMGHVAQGSRLRRLLPLLHASTPRRQDTLRMHTPALGTACDVTPMPSPPQSIPHGEHMAVDNFLSLCAKIHGSPAATGA